MVGEGAEQPESGSAVMTFVRDDRITSQMIRLSFFVILSLCGSKRSRKNRKCFRMTSIGGPIGCKLDPQSFGREIQCGDLPESWMTKRLIQHLLVLRRFQDLEAGFV